MPGDDGFLDLKRILGPGRGSGVEVHNDRQGPRNHPQESLDRHFQPPRKSLGTPLDPAPAPRIPILDVEVELVATLNSEIFAIQGLDVRFLELSPDIVHLVGGEGLKDLTHSEVAQVYAGFPHQGPGGPVKEDGIIGARETAGHMQADVQVPTTRDRDRILDASLDKKEDD